MWRVCREFGGVSWRVAECSECGGVWQVRRRDAECGESEAEYGGLWRSVAA